MHVVACQWDLAWEDKPANFERVRMLLGQSPIAPGSVIVLPEMFATGFSMNVAAIAEEPLGATATFLSALASERSSYVIGGIVSRGTDGWGRNEALVVSPDGKPIARYHKLHPFSLGGESRHYAAGEGLTLFDFGPLRVAVFICYDLRFPEVFRLATRQGAQAFVVIANWPVAREHHWTTLLQARAIENQAYVIGVNRIGSDPHLAYGGRSLIIDPRGQVVSDGGNGEGTIEATLDLPALLEYRRQFPAIADLRPEFLGQTR